MAAKLEPEQFEHVRADLLLRLSKCGTVDHNQLGDVLRRHAFERVTHQEVRQRLRYHEANMDGFERMPEGVASQPNPLGKTDVVGVHSRDVTAAEAADSVKHVAVQVSTADSSPAHTQPGIKNPAAEAVSKAPRHWQKAAVVGACAVLLASVGVASWRHFGSMTPPGSQKIMLAVLPFQNLTGDPDKEYLADGLTEETISLLGRLNPEQLGVIARTSVMGYKHKDERLDQIGRDLSVQYVLENSLRESGDHIRLTAQLIQVKDQTHLWSQEYDYPVKDFLTVEDDVA